MFVEWFLDEITSIRIGFNCGITSMDLEHSARRSVNERWDKAGGELIKVALEKFGDFGDC